MSNHHNGAKALFLSPDGNIYPDTFICSGVIPPELGGKPCPYACDGGIPDAIPLNPDDATYTPDKGQPGDLCPPCVKQQLSNLGHWQGHSGQTFPEELLALRLFKCRQWFWLVVPGLQDQTPDRIASHNDL
jgi:hypothetical protein